MFLFCFVTGDPLVTQWLFGDLYDCLHIVLCVAAIYSNLQKALSVALCLATPCRMILVKHT